MNLERKFEERFFAIVAIMMVGLLIFISSCKKSSINSTETDNTTGTTGALVGGTSAIDNSSIASGTAEGSTEVGANVDDLIANSTFSSVVTINFGTTITITNPFAASGVTITQSGGDVMVTSTATGVDFQLSGATNSGSVKVYSEKKFKLTLNGVDITNNDGPALNIQSSKRFFVDIKDNTTNTLVDAAAYATSTEDMKGTIFSEGQMIIVGNGTLNVKGNYKHAIVSDDYIRVVAGNINITGAVSDGIHSNDAVIIDGGTVKITATGDGIQADEGHVIINAGTITTNTVDKGISAAYEGTDATIVPYLTINGGTITVNSSKGEGIESKGALTINNGTIAVSSYDDGINASTAIYINGGSIYAYATNNDAMDSNGIFTITGGKIVAIGANNPEASIDCDARTLKITGGLLVGIAGATSGPTASVSTVRSVVMGSGTAQLIHLEATDGTEAITFLAPKSYSTMIVAGSKLKANTSYTVYTAGSVSADATNFHGLYLTGTYNRGYKGATFTTTNVVTQTGGSISRG
jgi:hypothetical protein